MRETLTNIMPPGMCMLCISTSRGRTPWRAKAGDVFDTFLPCGWDAPRKDHQGIIACDMGMGQSKGAKLYTGVWNGVDLNKRWLCCIFSGCTEVKRATTWDLLPDSKNRLKTIEVHTHPDLSDLSDCPAFHILFVRFTESAGRPQRARIVMVWQSLKLFVRGGPLYKFQ